MKIFWFIWFTVWLISSYNLVNIFQISKSLSLTIEYLGSDVWSEKNCYVLREVSCIIQFFVDQYSSVEMKKISCFNLLNLTYIYTGGWECKLWSPDQQKILGLAENYNSVVCKMLATSINIQFNSTTETSNNVM